MTGCLCVSTPSGAGKLTFGGTLVFILLAVTRTIMVFVTNVTNEGFLRPGYAEAFTAGSILGIIAFILAITIFVIVRKAYFAMYKNHSLALVLIIAILGLAFEFANILVFHVGGRSPDLDLASPYNSLNAWAGLWTTLKYCGTVCFIVQLFHFLWISYNSWKAGKKLEKDPEYLAKLEADREAARLRWMQEAEDMEAARQQEESMSAPLTEIAQQPDGASPRSSSWRSTVPTGGVTNVKGDQ